MKKKGSVEKSRESRKTSATNLMVKKEETNTEATVKTHSTTERTLAKNLAIKRIEVN